MPRGAGFPSGTPVPGDRHNRAIREEGSGSGAGRHSAKERTHSPATTVADGVASTVQSVGAPACAGGRLGVADISELRQPSELTFDFSP